MTIYTIVSTVDTAFFIIDEASHTKPRGRYYQQLTTIQRQLLRFIPIEIIGSHSFGTLSVFDKICNVVVIIGDNKLKEDSELSFVITLLWLSIHFLA